MTLSKLLIYILSLWAIICMFGCPLDKGTTEITISRDDNDGISGNGTIDFATASFVDGGGVDGINYDVTKNGDMPHLFQFNSKLYAAWYESNGTKSQIRVAVFDGTSLWSFVDGNGVNGINKDTSQNAYFPKLFEFNSKLYIFWAEDNGTAIQTRVAVYNGDDDSPSWSFVDGDGVNGLNKDITKDVNLIVEAAEFNSKLYLTWNEENDPFVYQTRVVVYNGDDGSPSWSFVDGNGANGLNKNPANSSGSARLIVFNSKLYLTWTESESLVNQIRIAVYNGNDGAPSWSFVDGNGVTGLNKNVTKSAIIPHIEEFDSRLYLIWMEKNDVDAFNARVTVYNGDDGSPTWSFVDGDGVSGLNKNTAHNVWRPRLKTFNSELYAAWYENNQIRVILYNGDDSNPSWSFIDGDGVNGLNYDTSQIAQRVKFCEFNSHLYLIWYEENTSGVKQIRVMKSNLVQ